ncbi:MAG: 50S ribosomal protein L6 [Patescibacteria group bacterium]|nr:MAG: 50S ribosomal protein L6 [Patescibacteria group bacterium]
MSRIGLKAISVPQGVTITVSGSTVAVNGPKGQLTVETLPGITVTVAEGLVSVTRSNDEKQTKAYHGLVRSLINNAVAGVSTGFKKTLKLIGTGYRAKAQGAGIQLAVGYSHPVDFAPLPGVTLKVEGTDTIHIEGIDRQAVGQVAANIRKIRPPEPYKGKGIRYEDEEVRRKQGKAAA